MQSTSKNYESSVLYFYLKLIIRSDILRLCLFLRWHSPIWTELSSKTFKNESPTIRFQSPLNFSILNVIIDSILTFLHHRMCLTATTYQKNKRFYFEIFYVSIKSRIDLFQKFFPPSACYPATLGQKNKFYRFNVNVITVQPLSKVMFPELR